MEQSGLVAFNRRGVASNRQLEAIFSERHVFSKAHFSHERALSAAKTYVNGL